MGEKNPIEKKYIIENQKIAIKKLNYAQCHNHAPHFDFIFVLVTLFGSLIKRRGTGERQTGIKGSLTMSCQSQLRLQVEKGD